MSREKKKPTPGKIVCRKLVCERPASWKRWNKTTNIHTTKFYSNWC